MQPNVDAFATVGVQPECEADADPRIAIARDAAETNPMRPPAWQLVRSVSTLVQRGLMREASAAFALLEREYALEQLTGLSESVAVEYQALRELLPIADLIDLRIVRAIGVGLEAQSADEVLTTLRRMGPSERNHATYVATLCSREAPTLHGIYGAAFSDALQTPETPAATERRSLIVMGIAAAALIAGAVARGGHGTVARNPEISATQVQRVAVTLELCNGAVETELCRAARAWVVAIAQSCATAPTVLDNVRAATQQTERTRVLTPAEMNALAQLRQLTRDACGRLPDASVLRDEAP